MKKSLHIKPIATIFLIVLVVFMVTPEAMSDTIDTITVQSVDGYHYLGGGEFTIYPSIGLQPVLGGYADVTRNIGAGGPNFQSFCMERSEGINQHGGVYAVWVNDRAINGGLDPLEPNVPGDPVSKGTAWLYHEFQKGTLSGYSYTPANGRSFSAGLLQQAIWWLEGELSYPDDPPFDPTENYYITLVNDKFGIDAMKDNDGEYPVSVLNLWLKDGEGFYSINKQDVLVCDPVNTPEPATMLLLGSGLIALGGLARRKFRK